MDREQELKLIDRCIEHAQAKTSQASDKVCESPIARYADPDRFGLERKLIFRRKPEIVCLQSQLSEPGQFITTEIAGVPILLVCGEDSQIRGFKNVCRHRGTILESARSGCRKRFECPYHAWTYMTDGTLAGIPHAPRGFPELERVENGLVELNTHQELGFVWVQIDGQRMASIRNYLGDFAPDIQAFGVQDLFVYGETTRQWDANWKLLAEGGMEAYHFRVAHAETIAKYFPDNVMLYDESNGHFRVTLPKTSILELQHVPVDRRRLVDHANVVYTVNPNTSFIHEKDHVVWLRTNPIAVDRTETTLRFLVPSDPKTWNDQEKKYWHINYELTDKTLTEDFVLNQSAQKAIASGANEVFRFGHFESALDDLNTVIESMLK